MAETSTKESHEERTAHEPRDMTLHDVVLSEIAPIGRLVRLLRLQIPAGHPDITFLPGQWVDCFVPGIAKAGGFTITSTPSQAVSQSGLVPRDRYIELAVKASPENPAAAWLWQDPASSILGQTLRLRVGGSFVFPPPGHRLQDPARFVFVAGGVGINPLISMVCHLGELNDASAAVGDERGTAGPEVAFLYSVREDEEGGDILFLQRLASLFSRKSVRGQLELFVTGGDSKNTADSHALSYGETGVPCKRRRVTTADVDAVVSGSQGTDNVYVYVCGVPTMTDAFVAHLTGSKDSGGLGLAAHQVLYEKWW